VLTLRFATARRPLVLAAAAALPVAVLLVPPAAASPDHVSAGVSPVSRESTVRADGAGDSSRVIVRLAGDPALAAGAGTGGSAGELTPNARAAVSRAHQQRVTANRALLATLPARGVPATVRASYADVFNGAALTVPTGDLDRLRATPGVLAVYPDRQVSASMDPALTVTRVPQVWQRTDADGNPTDGRGETVAILDTGIDYRHPDLGAGFGAGHKVVGGYDDVNNDADPLDDNGHGTHVAGIVAATASGPDGVTGVAPGAELTAYKVLDGNGNGMESTIIQGLEQAVALDNPHRADVINMSLGGHAGSDDPLGQAAATVAASGVVVVAAAGNDGPGDGTAASPANAPGVLSVGASFSGVDLPAVTEISPHRSALTTPRHSGSATPPGDGETLSLVDVAGGSDDDYTGLDVRGKAVLVTFPPAPAYASVMATAAAHGVAAVVMYTPDYFSRGELDAAVRATGNAGDIGGYPFVAVEVDGTTATTLREHLDEGVVRLRIDGQDATDLIASFSSHGPATDTFLPKPDLVAPGVEIRSTWLTGARGAAAYHLDSGTSMAAPHVAGAAALLLQDHHDWTAGEVAAALASAAHPLANMDPTTAGSGRLDVAAADAADVLPTPWSVQLGVADMGRSATASAQVTLHNASVSPATVRLRVEHSAGGSAKVTVKPAAVRIAAGGSQRVTVTATGPAGSTPYDVSGWINGTVTLIGARSAAGHSSQLRMPYLMAVRPLQLHPTPDPTAGPESIEVYAAAPLTDAPRLTVRGPDSTTLRLVTTPARDHWWKADLPATGTPGVYRVTAQASTATGELTGAEEFTRLGDRGNTDWESVGPVGDAGVLVTSTDDPDVGYMLPGHTEGALLQRTADGGDTWQPVGQGVLDSAVPLAVAADPADADTVYVVANGTMNTAFEGRVMVSHDRGSTWSALPLPDLSYRDVETSGDGEVVAVSAFDGSIRWSADGGVTWSTVQLPATEDPSALSFSGRDLYLIAGAELWKLPDVGSGAAPQEIFTQPGQYPTLTAVAGHAGAVAVAGYDAAFGGTRTVAVSADGGASWSTSAPSNAVVSALSWAGDDLFASADPHSWRLAAGSHSWQAVTGPPEGMQQFAMLGGQQTVSVSRIGVYRTTDGLTYQRIGTASTLVSSVAITTGADGTANLLAGTTYGSYETPVPEGVVTPAVRDWGRNGTETSYGKSQVALAADPADRRVVYALQRDAFSRFEVQKSTDGGATWDTVEAARTSAIPYQVAVSPADSSYIYVAEQDALGYGVLVSTNGGASWRRYAAAGPITTVLPDPQHARSLWLGGPNGLYRSTDGGQSMQPVNGTPVSALAVDPHHSSALVLGGASLWTSNDGGHTLHRARLDAARMRVSDLTFVGARGICAATADYLDDARLQVGGRGILCSSDGGRSWRDVSGKLPMLSVSSLTASPDGRWLFAGTNGGGVYRASVQSVVR
jgi:subtilisin family serine protease